MKIAIGRQNYNKHSNILHIHNKNWDIQNFNANLDIMAPYPSKKKQSHNAAKAILSYVKYNIKNYI